MTFSPYLWKAALIASPVYFPSLLYSSSDKTGTYGTVIFLCVLGGSIKLTNELPWLALFPCTIDVEKLV